MPGILEHRSKNLQSMRNSNYEDESSGGMNIGGMNLGNSYQNFYNLNMRDSETVKMSTHITGRPTNLYETNQQRLKTQENFNNNRKFYKMTHTECTKQNVKESVDLSKFEDLPEEY